MTALHVSRFAASDLDALNAQAGQVELAVPGHQARVAAMALAAGQAFTVRHGATIVLCGGAVENHPGYATLWAALSGDAGPHMRGLTRKTTAFIDMLSYSRLDALVRPDFEPAQRWMEMLGFRMEAVMRRFWPDGGDALIYIQEKI